MNITKFKDSFVKIEFLESANAYGHHPFQLFVVTADDKNEINALVGLEIFDIIARVKHYKKANAKDIFLSMDLPKCGDILEDFIFVMHIDGGGRSESIVIEYNPEDGDVLRENDGKKYEVTATLLSYFGV